MPSPLTSALAAALVAGTVVAATAIGDSGHGADRVRAARAKPLLIAPTRAQAIEAAAAFRTRANRLLAERLEVTDERLLAAERAIVGRQLGEAVDSGLLSEAQRDALLACFDDPVGCDRGALPVQHAGIPPGGVPLPLAVRTPVDLVLGRVPRPVVRGRGCRPTRDRRRDRRPVPCRLRVPPGPDAALARELSLPRKAVAAAMRGTSRAIVRDLDARSGPPADPDGVPLGVPFALLPFPIGAFLPGHALVEPRPLPAPPRRPRRP